MPKIDWEQARLQLRINEAALEQTLEGTAEQIARVYQERAIRLAAGAAHEARPSDTFPVLVFHLAKERFGIELYSVAAVLRGLSCTSVPESRPELQGVLNVNGEIRPILNLRFLLGLTPADQNSVSDTLLLRKKGHELSIQVDLVEQVRWISHPPARCSEGGASTRFVCSITPDTLILLRASALFAEFWSEEFES